MSEKEKGSNWTSRNLTADEHEEVATALQSVEDKVLPDDEDTEPPNRVIGTKELESMIKVMLCEALQEFTSGFATSTFGVVTESSDNDPTHKLTRKELRDLIKEQLEKEISGGGLL